MAPALAALGALVVQAALWAHADHAAAAAAAQGARAAAAAGSSPEDGARAAKGYLRSLGPGLVTDLRVEADRIGAHVHVSVHGQAIQLLPGVTLTVGAQASRAYETTVADRP